MENKLNDDEHYSFSVFSGGEKIQYDLKCQQIIFIYISRTYISYTRDRSTIPKSTECNVSWLGGQCGDCDNTASVDGRTVSRRRNGRIVVGQTNVSHNINVINL